MVLSTLLYIGLVLLQSINVCCLDCYECSNIHNVSLCHTTAVCQHDHICSITSSGTGSNIRYSLGCRQKDQCPGLSKTTTISPAPSIVGRDVVSLSCDQCCATNACNKDMCQHHLHGGWSSWSGWGSCSLSCSMGLQTKTRTCSNPPPPMSGDQCDGESMTYQACFEQACSDGGWSRWTGWSSCTRSCNGGLNSRTRTCNNPAPSKFGRSCVGNRVEKDTCNTTPCPVQHVAFSVNNPSTKLQGYIPIFSAITSNVGGAYNATTGIFTCPVNGLYTFSVSVTASPNSGQYAVTCYIYYERVKNHNIRYTGYAAAYTHSNAYDQGSITSYLELLQGDIVHPSCTNWQYVFAGESTVFSGALISP